MQTARQTPAFIPCRAASFPYTPGNRLRLPEAFHLHCSRVDCCIGCGCYKRTPLDAIKPLRSTSPTKRTALATLDRRGMRLCQIGREMMTGCQFRRTSVDIDPDEHIGRLLTLRECLGGLGARRSGYTRMELRSERRWAPGCRYRRIRFLMGIESYFWYSVDAPMKRYLRKEWATRSCTVKAWHRFGWVLIGGCPERQLLTAAAKNS